ncbi:MAG: hypothetical protein WCD55_07630 [Bacteroidales bacterium]
MDELEKHIKNERAGMDIYEPDPNLWNRIEKGLPGRERHFGRYLWRAAAAVIITAALITALLRVIIIPHVKDDPQLVLVSETYLYYDNQLRSLYKEAKPLLTANPDINTELEKGMGELDSLSLQIRNDLKDNVASEEVIGALIRNYRLRIELLEDMLTLMKEKEADNENITHHEL